jgi:hypothetical protein
MAKNQTQFWKKIQRSGIIAVRMADSQMPQKKPGIKILSFIDMVAPVSGPSWQCCFHVVNDCRKIILYSCFPYFSEEKYYSASLQSGHNELVC